MLVLGIGTGDPTHVDSRYRLYRSANLPDQPAERATLYLVREQRGLLNALPDQRVYVDGDPAGILPQRSWFLMHVEAGSHRVSGIMFCPDLILDCKPGRAYLLRLREVTDTNDRRSASLLLDDPETIRDLIEMKRLAFVETTTRGMDYLRARLRSHPERSSAPRIEARLQGQTDTLPHVLVEKPLDTMNLRREFSGLTGRLILDRTTIAYRMEDSIRSSSVSWRKVRDVFEISGEGIVKVRFDGTRFTGVTPWVNIIYRTANGLHTVSFADAREPDGSATYNRVFAVAQDLMETYRELAQRAAADSTRRD